MHWYVLMTAPMVFAPDWVSAPMAPTDADTLTYIAIFVDPVSVPAAVVPFVASAIFVHPDGVVIVALYGLQ